MKFRAAVFETHYERRAGFDLMAVGAFESRRQTRSVAQERINSLLGEEATLPFVSLRIV